MRKNINKKIILSIIIILSITFISTISKAALEFKAEADKYQPGVTQAYQLCFNLKNADSTLGTNQVDPHLMLNKDWTAVVFLAISTYGNADNIDGKYIAEGARRYHTSNGNRTGVMGYGTGSYGQITSSIYEKLEGNKNEYYQPLIDNINTKYVEKLKLPVTSEENKGLGFFEGTASGVEYSEQNPIIFKYAIFSYNCSIASWAKGSLFRPAIWNIDR